MQNQKLVEIDLENIGTCKFCECECKESDVVAKININTGSFNNGKIFICEQHLLQFYKNFQDELKDYFELRSSVLDKNFENEKKRINDLSKELFSTTKS